jgi:acyl CoA:acetate/3-ketoacid CoA transferase beta subunit
MDYTIDELISVCIARQVQDGEILAQGINTPLVMAGLILAQCTHAPNAAFVSAIGQGLTRAWGQPGVGRAEERWLDKTLVNIGFGRAVAEFLPTYDPKEFFRPAQVDAAGNFNNIAFHRPRTRLPGSGGIPDVTVTGEKIHLYVPRHSKVIFAERIDYISGLGHVPQRKRGRGAVYCISDLGQFDWANGRMRLISTHRGESVESVQKRTGFALEIAPEVHETPPPSVEELRLLREVIDPLGVRKLETLGGAARKALLRDILAQEGVL